MLESPWISVLTLSNTDSQGSKRSKHRKTYQGKIAHVVEEPKKADSRLFFALNGVLEKWEMSPWKFLEFFVLKMVRTLKLVTRHFSTNEKARLCLSTNKSKHRPSDKKLSKQRTESDRISHHFEALRHIFKTFHDEAHNFFKWTAYRKPYWKCLVKYSAHFVAYFFFYRLNNALYRRDFGPFSR